MASVILNYFFPTPVTSSQSNELQTRKNELIQKIRTIESRLGKTHPCNIQIGKFEASAYADTLKNSMIIPSWYFIKYDEIPANFRINNLDDPRLDNDQFLNDLSAWMEGKIKELGMTSKNASIDSKDTLKFVIRLTRDRDGFEQAKDFLLAHETAHLSHDLCVIGTINHIIAWAPLVCSLLTVAMTIVLIPYVPFVVVLGVGGGISLTSAIGLLVSKKLQAPFWIAEEKKADQDGIQALQRNTRGGVYFFDTMRQHQLKLKMKALSLVANREPPNKWTMKGPTLSLWDPVGSVKNYIAWFNNVFTALSITEDGDYTLDDVHPPLTERINYLRNYLNP